ncbi:MAG TPA: hypothetical protein VMK12_04380, partial [Anaeromyxobacteraceae bacterium]|nr:hypothetical protein [Anaeromyxobacteraceae bacterium]
ERLFSYPGILQRHRTGPLAEREVCLESLAAQGFAQGTLLKTSHYSSCVAESVDQSPARHRVPEGRSL